MKKKIVYGVLAVFLLANTSNTFAFSWGNWFSWGKNMDLNKVENEVKNKVNINTKKEDVVKKIQKKRSSVNDTIGKNVLNTLKMEKKVLEKVEKNKKLKESIDKIEKKGEVMKMVNNITTRPIVNEKVKTYTVNKLKSINSQVVDTLDTSVIAKLGGAEDIKSFKLTDTFNPDKVITFDNIKELAITNLILYKKLLSCDDPDDAVVDLCSNITNLLDELTDENKKLTINDVYKLQVYQSTIAQAIFYAGTLKEFKKGAIVLGVDKKTNMLKSFDVVRSYTTYDIANNDVLPLVAKEIKIDMTPIKPTMKGNNIKIVLGLKDGSLVGMKVYPIDKDATMSYANMYKIMEIKGLTRGCASGKFTDSFWFGYGKIGLSHEGKNLQPKGTKGIKFNLDENCYDVF